MWWRKCARSDVRNKRLTNHSRWFFCLALKHAETSSTIHWKAIYIMQRSELIAELLREVQDYWAHASTRKQSAWTVVRALHSVDQRLVIKIMQMCVVLTRSCGKDWRCSRTLTTALGRIKPVHSPASAARMTRSFAHWCMPLRPAPKLIFCKKSMREVKQPTSIQSFNRKIRTSGALAI